VGAYLVTGNPGSGKSAVCAELSRRGLAAVDTDDLAFWADSAGVQVDPPDAPDAGWLRNHRWVWSRSRIEQYISASGGSGCVFFCGIAVNQSEMLDLFQEVFLLVIDDVTQRARLSARTEAVKQQIREGLPVFQAQMLAHGAVPLDGTAEPAAVTDSLLAYRRHRR
jgi:dephospho-CoA kinase